MLVYAGAIMVLFLFVIMLLNLGRRRTTDLRGSLSIGGAVAVAGLLGVELGAALGATRRRDWRRSSCRPAPRLPGRNPAGADVGQHRARRGRARCSTPTCVPFEVTIVLLLAAIVGAVVLGEAEDLNAPTCSARALVLSGGPVQRSAWSACCCAATRSSSSCASS